MSIVDLGRRPTIDELEARLPEEQAKLADAEERCKEPSLRVAECERELVIIESAARKDSQDAFIARRAPNRDLDQRLEAARAALRDAQSTQREQEAALTAARDRQAAFVKSIEAEMFAQRRKLLGAEIREPKALAWALADQLGDVAIDLRDKARKHGFPNGVPIDLMFEDYNWQDPIGNACNQERQSKADILHAALTLRQMKGNK